MLAEATPARLMGGGNARSSCQPHSWSPLSMVPCTLLENLDHSEQRGTGCSSGCTGHEGGAGKCPSCLEQLSAGTAKAGFRCSFNHHDCSGTASQVTPQGRHQHVNASSGKVGFELATDGIQLYVFANSLNIPRCYPYRSTLPAPVGSRPAAHAWPGPGRHPG